MRYGYIGPTPIHTYGCTMCQRWHRLGLDPEFESHLGLQSKHGVQEREPIGTAEEFAAALQAERREENRRKGVYTSF